jgi:hypothetical protein
MAGEPQPEDAPRLPIVHVLVSEDFFWERVVGTLRALRKEPHTPQLADATAEAVFEQIADRPAIGAVLDLEDGAFNALSVLRRILKDKRTRGWTLVVYCSHENKELQAAATALGQVVVPRSTFAANLVKVLQAFGLPDAKEP